MRGTVRTEEEIYRPCKYWQRHTTFAHIDVGMTASTFLGCVSFDFGQQPSRKENITRTDDSLYTGAL